MRVKIISEEDELVMFITLSQIPRVGDRIELADFIDELWACRKLGDFFHQVRTVMWNRDLNGDYVTLFVERMTFFG